MGQHPSIRAADDPGVATDQLGPGLFSDHGPDFTVARRACVDREGALLPLTVDLLPFVLLYWDVVVHMDIDILAIDLELHSIDAC